MIDLELAKLLLDKASGDAKALSGMQDRQTFLDEIFGFHAQQAVEKALKAWLCVRGVSYPKIHDIEILLAMLAQNGETVTQSFRSLSYLNDFGVQFRMPLLLT